MEPERSPLEQLRELGLTLEIDERAAQTIVAELLIVDGRLRRGVYAPGDSSSHTTGHFHAAYDAIAAEVVHAETPLDVLEIMIPRMVHALRAKQNWVPDIPIEVLTRWLQGPINEWKGRRIKKSLRRSAVSTSEVPSKPPRKMLHPKPGLLKTLPTVNRKTAAEALGVTERTLDRHVKRGFLVPVGPPSRKRFKSKDLLQFLDQKKDRQM
jgi:hypothetical protein